MGNTIFNSFKPVPLSLRLWARAFELVPLSLCLWDWACGPESKANPALNTKKRGKTFHEWCSRYSRPTTTKNVNLDFRSAVLQQLKKTKKHHRQQKSDASKIWFFFLPKVKKWVTGLCCCYRWTNLGATMCTGSLGYSTENSPSKKTSLRWGDDCSS